MGTGIVAIAGATLPVHVVGLRAFAQVVWVIAAVLLVALIVVVGGHWLRHPTVARTHARNPTTWTGRVAPAMATMPVPITEANQLGPMLPRTSTRVCGDGAPSRFAVVIAEKPYCAWPTRAGMPLTLQR
ncbi:hypothetical protein A9X03_05660 [Mycobacterium sp. E1715]|nr:hypothetical protein A9X03_05660 [Mycobacterium sp. E1715]